MDGKPLSYVVVGSGWRSLFYWRVAQAYPMLFEMKAMLCRSQEKAGRMQREYGVGTVTTMEACERLSPDFIVVAVNKDAVASVAGEWVRRGYPVLLETPAAMDVGALKELWRLRIEAGARIQVAEQYFLYPSHAAAIAAVRQGWLGDPYTVEISTVHDYHAASLVRRYLNLGLEPMTVWGEEYFFPVEETGSRYGPVMDGHIKEQRRVRVNFAFDCGGGKRKYAFYDFDGIQYHSFIRGRHLSVKGQAGELDDRILRYVDSSHVPHAMELVPEYAKPGGGIRRVSMCGRGGMGRRTAADGELLYENPFVQQRQGVVLGEDETAVGSVLLGMGRFLADGLEVYPLAEALQDAYTRILMEEAVARGAHVRSGVMPWMDK